MTDECKGAGPDSACGIWLGHEPHALDELVEVTDQSFDYAGTFGVVQRGLDGQPIALGVSEELARQIAREHDGVVFWIV